MATPSPLFDSLPGAFDFYHMGRITPSDEPPVLHTASEDRIGVAFGIGGDIQGTLVLLLDDELDVSTYSEAGNIIASQLANSLASREGHEVTITPPRVLSRERLKQLLESGTASAKTYHHHLDTRTIRLTALILEKARTGNA